MGNSFAINEGLSSEIATFISSFLWKKSLTIKIVLILRFVLIV